MGGARDKLRKLVKCYLKYSWTIYYASDEIDAIIKALRKALHMMPINQLNITIQRIGGVNYRLVFTDLNLKAVATVSRVPGKIMRNPSMKQLHQGKFIVTFISCRELPCNL